MSDPKKELVTKVRHLVDLRHGGDFNSAFRHYANSHSADAKVNRGELIQLLTDAGIGNSLTRGRWASGVMEEIDTDGDDKISASEFAGAIGR